MNIGYSKKTDFIKANRKKLTITKTVIEHF